MFELERVSKQIRKLSTSIALIMDTKGHKIRLSDFQKEIKVKIGQKFSLHTKKITKGTNLVPETKKN